MKRILAIASLVCLTAIPTAANASYIDVINIQLKPSCTFQKFMGIVGDFNKWGVKYGYSAQVAVPLQNQDLQTIYWIGTTKNATAFGAAWDAWRDSQATASSAPAMLQARFAGCSTNKTRTGYDVF